MHGLEILKALLDDRSDEQTEERRLAQRVADLEHAIVAELEDLYPRRLGVGMSDSEQTRRHRELLDELAVDQAAGRPPGVASVCEVLNGFGAPSWLQDMDPEELADAVAWMRRTWKMSPEPAGNLWPDGLFDDEGDP